MAAGNLHTQAVALGLVSHPMGGFGAQKLRASLQIPEGHEILSVIAIGYPGSVEALPETLRERELLARTRKPQQEFVFEGVWQHAQ
jgi:nitroreductase